MNLAASVAVKVAELRPTAPACTCDTLANGWLCTHCKVINALVALDESLDAYLAEMEADRIETDRSNREQAHDDDIEAR
jgi:hypothetical protein